MPTRLIALVVTVCAVLALQAQAPVPTAHADSIVLQQLATGLSEPTAIATPGDGNLYIAQKGGRIRIFDGTQILAQDFLNVAPLMTLTHVEQGLLGIAFHPDFNENGFVYVHFTPTIDTVEIARFTVPNGSLVADIASRQTILTVPHPSLTHFGGQLAFGPDGRLYIAIGDGGTPNDEDNNAQNIEVLLGKILRIDVDAAFPYVSPADNRFAGATPGRDEIWMLGLRNPWRFSFDRVTGDFFVGDVGEDAWEEINHQPVGVGGANFGWRLKEGTDCFNPPVNCDPGGLTDPIITHPHDTDGNCSITGGHMYRGPEASFDGTYVYGDFCSGRIWGATTDDGGVTWTSTLLADTTAGITSFGEDEHGNLYVADYFGGRLFRLDIADTDGDGILDTADNCPLVSNPGQENNDRNFIPIPSRPFDDVTRPNSDEVGDACDDDDDNDGLLDVDEIAGEGPCSSASGPTDPMALDTDGDRFADGAECLLGSDPASAASVPDLTGVDSDGDGLPDAVEVAIGSNPNDVDTDGDGVTDGIEFLRYNTDPNVIDMDNDGCEDGEEIASVNLDTSINSIDLFLVAQGFGAGPGLPYELAFDVNKDGAINSLDLLFVAQHFGPCTLA